MGNRANNPRAHSAPYYACCWAGAGSDHLGVLRVGDIGDRDGLLMDIQTDVRCARVSWLTFRLPTKDHVFIMRP